MCFHALFGPPIGRHLLVRSSLPSLRRYSSIFLCVCSSAARGRHIQLSSGGTRCPLVRRNRCEGGLTRWQSKAALRPDSCAFGDLFIIVVGEGYPLRCST